MALLIAAFCFVTFAINARAQCPDDTWGPPPSVTVAPWTSLTTSQAMPGFPDCQVLITYCKRDLPDGSVQVWIESAVLDPNSNCTGVDPATVIAAARDLVVNEPAVNGQRPCFKPSFTITNVYTARCWSEQQSFWPGGQNAFGLYPCIGSGWCQKSCQACVNGDGTVTLSNCTYVGQYVDMLCDTPPGVWQLNQCYTIGCPN